MLKGALCRHRGWAMRLAQSFVKFDRSKAHVNVGTVGHIDHGKTTLTSAITKYLAARNQAVYLEYEKIDKAPEEKARGITINTTTLQYETDRRHYAHVDCPGHIDYVKNMITGAAKMDAAILVVSGLDGPMPQTREHVLLCRQVGVGQIIIYINKVDLLGQNLDMLDLVEDQLNDLLRKHEYDPTKTAYIKGSALCAIQDTNPQLGMQSIGRLLDALDTKIQISGRQKDKPFLMPIESTYNIAGRGAIACGTVEQGYAKIGEDIEFYGYGKTLRSQIVGIETFNKSLDHGEAGDNIGLLVRGLTREQMHRGLIIAKPGSLTTHSVIEANIYCLTTEEGGRINTFTSGYRPQLYFKTADTAAEICLPEGVKFAKPGDNLTIKAKLNFPLTVSKGSRFALREGGKTIAAGIITQILPEDTVLDFGKVRKVKPNQQPKAASPAASTKPDGKGAASPAKTAAGGKTPPPAGKTPPPPAGKTPPPPAGKTPPPPPAGKTPPPPAGKTPPPPAGKTTPPPPATKTPPPPAGKTPPPPATKTPPPPAGKTPPPPAGKTPPPPAGKTPPKK